ncbi:Xylose repressor [Staphylococcus microti]|uniref:Xylose repressor n=2 Tax=Staphylococcus microti TaxID=569857 RepID=A0A380GRU7_9STAP|nr:ROK family transcriptional regulator [Staphylococcus microti]PNZ84026.1 ROK family transcriptional regulator [Staphylococcus microti]SUM56504.1 Xylose repressor [Staphylococcus microti]
MKQMPYLSFTANERMVLKTIFNHKPLSMTDISQLTNTNKATISGVLNHLKAQQLVCEVGQGESTKKGGRKTILLEINPDFGYTVSLDFTYDSVDMMVNAFNGKVLAYDSYPLTEKTMAHALSIVESKLNPSDQRGTQHGLLGIAVSIHGIVNQDQSIRTLPFLELDDISVRERLEQYAEVPILIENEANLAALYEHALRNHTCTESLATLSIHKGIGAGLILNNQLYRGSDGSAGEIGQSLVLVSDTQPVHYDKIENICSQDALVSRLRAHLNEPLTLETISQYYKAQHPIVREEVQTFVERIAVLIYNFSMQLNPAHIYINCPIMNEIPEILTQIQDQLHTLSYDATAIRLTSNVQYATLFGGALGITQQILNIGNIKLDFSS